MSTLASAPSSRELADRVLASFPSGTYGLPALLRVLEGHQLLQIDFFGLRSRRLPRTHPYQIALLIHARGGRAQRSQLGSDLRNRLL